MTSKDLRGRFLNELPWSSSSSLKNMDRPKRLLMYAYGAFFGLILLTIAFMGLGPKTPSLKLKYKQESPYDPRKVAVIIENRPMGHLVPLLLHFSSVIPPEWRVRFMGSPESVDRVNETLAIRQQVDTGKMDLTYIPSNMSVAGTEQISVFLTNLWVYETLLAPAEWLLVFQTDSILCANSEQSLNDWLEYDWVGAPWKLTDRYGGNGGLSLRRVSSIIEVLRHQSRIPGDQPEDVWLSERLGNRPGAKVANGTLELAFSGEQLHSEKPMGYHLGGSGKHMPGGSWGTPERREENYAYCPEIKMILDMDMKEFIPGDCNAYWKRSEELGMELVPW